ncbi:hypothetical protein GCM10009347_26440 [Shewanella algicola]|uniref:Uncharacterized protein n=1 Tax=Shewanella algicola TaxID=640633 RepID=A0A9X1ZA05_9GAMM|nr:hypothetical protein [Shewanella algicola]MCL1106382.1 hypothetical protein [Shewanella algicola]GGP58756.1 hypothetical protein GCM10009347_26440 [Shewanella algicola]
MSYEQLIKHFKTVTDIDLAIDHLSKKVKSMRKSAINATTLAEKLAINKEIKAINEINFKLKMNYFALEDELNNA